ncbi:MAG TPA: GtrA family protein [Sphingomicrobium sp.]|nr:GtrA family protein [Sphingomicrobium sp.]
MINVREPLRYSAVSAICLLLGTTLIPLLSSWGLHYSIATVAAFSIVAVIGFTLHCYWTFDVERSLASFVRYVGAIALNIPLMIVIIAIAHEIAGFSVTRSTMIASSILLAWNYLAVRWAVACPPSGEAP